MSMAGEQNRAETADPPQDTTQAATAYPQPGLHSCAQLPDPKLSCTLHHAVPLPAPQHLEPNTGTRDFRPREVTPDRLSSVLHVLAEGRGCFTPLCIFCQNELKPGLLSSPDNYQSQGFHISQRPAHLQEGHPRGRAYPHTGCLQGDISSTGSSAVWRERYLRKQLRPKLTP